VPRMHFNDGFVAGWICIDRGRGSAPRKTAVQTPYQETFRAVNLKEEP
jgi:predicted RNase H-like nuclease